MEIDLHFFWTEVNYVYRLDHWDFYRLKNREWLLLLEPVIMELQNNNEKLEDTIPLYNEIITRIKDLPPSQKRQFLNSAAKIPPAFRKMLDRYNDPKDSEIKAAILELIRLIEKDHDSDDTA